MMRHQAETGSRIYQEVHSRDGVSQQKELAAGELSHELPLAALEFSGQAQGSRQLRAASPNRSW